MPAVRVGLLQLLAEFPSLVVVGEASHVEEALAIFHAVRPEVLFLDVQMPGGSGFDLLERLPDPPQVIFTTAFDQHAVRAFEAMRYAQ